MNKELFDKYVEERYESQMKFYSDKSKFNKDRYQKYQLVLIILSAITPVLAALGGKSYKILFFKISETDMQIAVVIIAALVAIFTSLLKAFDYQGFWIRYRSTNEKLKPEIHYYDFGVGPYGAKDIDKESLFVTRVEAVLDDEHKLWPAAAKKEDSDGSDGGAGKGGDGNGNGNEEAGKEGDAEAITKTATSATSPEATNTDASATGQTDSDASATSQATGAQTDNSTPATTDPGAGTQADTATDVDGEANGEGLTK